MVVAKRQRKEKPVKMDQKKIWGLEWEPQVKQTALLASPIYIGQAQWEETKHKKRSQDWASLFWVSPPSYLEDILSFACQIKLSCHLAVTLVCCFKSLLPWDRTKEITHSTSISGAATQFNLAETTSARPQWGGETEHNRSPTWRKLTWWKLNAKKIQCSGSEKKPSILETGTAKTDSAESSRSSVSYSRRPSVKVGGPHAYGWKDIWLTKSQFLCSLSFLVSLNPLQTGWGQWVQLRDSGKG